MSLDIKAPIIIMLLSKLLSGIHTWTNISVKRTKNCILPAIEELNRNAPLGGMREVWLHF